MSIKKQNLFFIFKIKDKKFKYFKFFINLKYLNFYFKFNS